MRLFYDLLSNLPTIKHYKFHGRRHLDREEHRSHGKICG